MKLRSGREFEPEATAVSRRGIDAEFAAEAFDAFADKSEANTSTRIGVAGMQTLEEAEYFLVVVGMDADAVIFDGDADETGRLGREASPYLGGDAEVGCDVRRDKFQRVADEVGQDLLEDRLVANDFAEGRHDFDAGLLVLDVFVELVEDFVQGRIEINGLDFKVGTSEAAISQQIVQERIHVFAGAQNAAEEIDPVLAEFAGGIVQQCLGEALHGAQRRAEVVGNGVVEGFEFAIDFDEGIDAMLEFDVKALDFVLGIFAGGDVARENIEEVLGIEGGGGPAQPAVGAVVAAEARFHGGGRAGAAHVFNVLEQSGAFLWVDEIGA